MRIPFRGLCALVLVAIACSGCSDTGNSDGVWALSASDEAELALPEMIGVVTRSDLAHDSHGPVYSEGVLHLEGGSTIMIGPDTESVDGCETVRIDDPATQTYVFDYSGCLALARLAEDGMAESVTLLDPLDGDDAYWVLTGAPWGVGSHLLIMRNSTIAFPYDPTIVTFRTEALSYPTGCDPGAGLLPWSVLVDETGVIVGVVGYIDTDQLDRVVSIPCGGTVMVD